MSAAAIAGFWYASLGTVTFVSWWLDKRAARAGRRRTSERTLLAFTVLGGFFGAMAGMRFLRHKNRKPLFVAAAVGSIALHLGAWAWLALR